MYAIIEDGAHQYKVQVGQTLDIQQRDVADGQKTVEFDRVVLVANESERKIGQPYVADATVTASIQSQILGDKIRILKYRRRKDSRTRKGHRQKYLRVTIDSIKS